EVQGRGIGGGTADDDGNVEIVDELLQVERFGDAGHMLGGDGGAPDDEQVDAGSGNGLVELLGALRRERSGDGDPGGTDLGQPRVDELGFDRLGVQLLHPHRGIGFGEVRDLREQRLRVVVPGPQALEVEYSEAAELAE